MARMVAFHNPDVTFLGLADRTALIGRAGRYEVVGAGSCTVLRGAGARRHPGGARVALEPRATVHARDDDLDLHRHAPHPTVT
jgi:hypothetical protein